MSPHRSRLARVLLAACAAALSACVTPGPQYLPLVIKDAATQQKPLVVEFYANWCKPCQQFEQHVLPDPRVQEALRDVMFVRYDVERPTGQDAQRRCRVTALPSMVGIDGTGKIRLLKQGTESTPDEFLVFLKQAKQVLGTQAAQVTN